LSERAIVAKHRGQSAPPSRWLDQVIGASPRHAQALWNRAVVLNDSRCRGGRRPRSMMRRAAARVEREAASRARRLRSQEQARAAKLKAVVETCAKLARARCRSRGRRRYVGVCGRPFY